MGINKPDSKQSIVEKQTDFNKLDHFLDQLNPTSSRSGRCYIARDSDEKISFFKLCYQFNSLTCKNPSYSRSPDMNKVVDSIRTKLIKLEKDSILVNRESNLNIASISLNEIFSQVLKDSDTTDSKLDSLQFYSQSGLHSSRFRRGLLKACQEDPNVYRSMSQGGLRLLPLDVRKELLVSWLFKEDAPEELIHNLFDSIPYETLSKNKYIVNKITNRALASEQSPRSFKMFVQYNNLNEICKQQNKNEYTILQDVFTYCCTSANSNDDIENLSACMKSLSEDFKVELLEMTLVQVCDFIVGQNETLDLNHFQKGLEQLLSKNAPLSGLDINADVALILSKTLLDALPEDTNLNDASWQRAINFVKENTKSIGINESFTLPEHYPNLEPFVKTEAPPKETVIEEDAEILLDEAQLAEICDDIKSILDQIPFKDTYSVHQELLGYSCAMADENDLFEEVLTSLNQLSPEDKLSLFENQLLEITSFAGINAQTSTMSSVQKALNTIYKNANPISLNPISAGTFLGIFRSLLDTLPSDQQRAIYTNPDLSAAVDYLNTLFPDALYDLPILEETSTEPKAARVSNQTPVDLAPEVSIPEELQSVMDDMQAIIEQTPFKDTHSVHQELIGYACAMADENDQMDDVLICLNQLSSENKLSLFENQLMEIIEYSGVDHQTKSMNEIQKSLDVLYRNANPISNNPIEAGTFLGIFRALLDTLDVDQQRQIYTDSDLMKAADFLTNLFPESIFEIPDTAALFKNPFEL